MPSQSPLRDGNGSGFDLIETLRWEPGAFCSRMEPSGVAQMRPEKLSERTNVSEASGFVRLERHLARLYASANQLGFACRPETVGSALGTIGGKHAHRVRLLLAADGKTTVTVQPFEPLPADKVWTLRIAQARLASDDPLLLHKTTRRDAYQAARAEFEATEADEVILLNERGEVCEGTIANVFVDAGDGGPLLTPPLSCGLLAGVLRGELLDEGKARQAVLYPVDLVSAKAVFVGNSLRGLIQARIA